MSSTGQKLEGKISSIAYDVVESTAMVYVVDFIPSAILVSVTPIYGEILSQSWKYSAYISRRCNRSAIFAFRWLAEGCRIEPLTIRLDKIVAFME